MVELRSLNDVDVPLVEDWLHEEHVRRWYEIPQENVSLDDWMHEINERHGEFKWLTHLIALSEGKPIGMCQYYRCKDADEDFGTLPLEGSYSIDYLIGEKSCVGKGLGKAMIASLVALIFTFPDAKRVTADIDRANTASEGVLLSCGFTLLDEEGSRYVLLREGCCIAEGW